MRPPSIPLELVDGCDLDPEIRRVLRPGEAAVDRGGHVRRLPRYFYEIPSWDAALNLQLTPHFGLWELIDVDVREAEAARAFPRYVPCAISALAAHLEVFRVAVGTVVRVAANGGYRSPAHRLNAHASTHSWGAAANLYRIGGDSLDSEEKIAKFADVARRVLPGIWVRPYGHGAGQTDDHLHLDVGFATTVPHGAPDEEQREAG